MEDDIAKRRETYFARAAEAERLAKAASDLVTRDALLNIAESWRALAVQVGRRFNG